MEDLENLLALDLEFRLTVAHRIDCTCSQYFITRWPVLQPEILKKAKELNIDPVDMLANYARGVHERHGG